MSAGPFNLKFHEHPFSTFELRAAAEHGWYLVTSMPLIREALRGPELYLKADIGEVSRWQVQRPDAARLCAEVRSERAAGRAGASAPPAARGRGATTRAS